MTRHLYIAGLFLVLTAVIYKWRVDETAWNTAHAAIVRLDSGVNYESLVQLRPRLADADAAVRDYSFSWRLFPIHHAVLVRNSENAIFDIGRAVDWEVGGGTADALVNSSDLEALQQYPDVTTHLTRLCSNGQIFTTRTAVSQAFLSRGLGLLQTAEGKPPDALLLKATSPPLDFAKETNRCEVEAKAEEAAAREADRKTKEANEKNEAANEKKYWAQFRYIVQLSMSRSIQDSCSFYLSIDGRGDFEVNLQPGDSQEFGVHQSMEIDAANCGETASPADLIQVTVNNQPYRARWGQHHAIILP